MENRKTFIGGSDAAAVLGMSRWKSPLSVWAEKTGSLPEEDISGKLQVRMGVMLEQAVADLFEQETGKKVKKLDKGVFHSEFPFIGAHVDRIVEGEKSILECKTCSPWKSGEWVDDEVPAEYIIQCLHMLNCMPDIERCYIAVIIGNQSFRWKVITRDDKICQQILKKEVEFWEKFVVPKIMPSATRIDDETLATLFPQSDPEKVVDLTDEHNKLIESLRAMKEDAKNLEGQIDKTENELKEILKDAQYGISKLYKISWTTQKSKRIDAEKIKTEFPDVYEKVIKEIPSRVFRTSIIKEKK